MAGTTRTTRTTRTAITAFMAILLVAPAVSAERLNDKDVKALLDRIDKTIDKATREASVKDADGVKQDAQKLASLVGDGRPASAEAQALLQRAAKVQAASSWAFGMPKRLP